MGTYTKTFKLTGPPPLLLTESNYTYSIQSTGNIGILLDHLVSLSQPPPYIPTPTMSLLRAAPLRIARSMPVARQQVRFAHVENVVDQYVSG